MPRTAKPSVRVFYSYAHEDEAFRDRLKKALALLKRRKVITEWHDREIVPGAAFDIEIREHLEAAHLILLLVSPDFVGSDYCYEKEMKRAMQRHRAKEARVMPILLRPCQWKKTPFGRLTALPTDGLPVTRWPDLDSAFLDIADGIERAAEEICASQPNLLDRSKGAKRPADLRDLPYGSSRNFSGRDEELKKVRAALTAGGRAALTALHGMGGVGKTQIALAYTEKHAPDYGTVGWLRAEEPATLDEDVRKLAVRLKLVKAEDTVEEVTDKLRDWMENTGDALVVFDNVPEPVAVKDYLPRWSGAHVLITSRYPDWEDVAEPVEVETWTRDAGADFLLKRLRLPAAARPDAVRVAETLDGLPLALEQAAAYIKGTGESLAGYLGLYEDLLDASDYAPGDYKRTVAATFALAFKEVREVSPGAAVLLQLCAFLAPEAVPASLIRDFPGTWPESLEAIRYDRKEWNAAVGTLRRFSLAKVEADRLSVHRLVQAVIRDRLDENAYDPDLPSVATLVKDFGDILNDRGDLIGARAQYERALRIGEEAYGPDHPNVAALVNNLGNVLRDMGDFTGAQAAFERALKIGEAAYGPEHPNVATFLNNLGVVVQEQGSLKGMLTGAQAAFERALKIGEAAYGPEHPNVASFLNNLGRVLQAQGKLTDAQAAYERAIRIDVAAYGPEHPIVASSISNLASVLQLLGYLTEAQAAYERAIRIDEAAYGPDHREVATDLTNLGNVLRAQGNLNGARAAFERALNIFERSLGPEHPSTKISRENLASLDG